jgi:hypothetical protein
MKQGLTRQLAYPQRTYTHQYYITLSELISGSLCGSDSVSIFVALVWPYN